MVLRPLASVQRDSPIPRASAHPHLLSSSSLPLYFFHSSSHILLFKHYYLFFSFFYYYFSLFLHTSFFTHSDIDMLEFVFIYGDTIISRKGKLQLDLALCRFCKINKVLDMYIDNS